MTLTAFSVQIMTGTTFKDTRTVESGLIFIQPILSLGVDVAIMTACRIISKRSVQIMTAATGFVFRGQTWIIVRRLAMVPDYACGHLAAVGVEMALGAVSIQIMTGTTFKGTRTVKSGLIFVEPLLSLGMGVAIMTACRIIAVRAIQLVTLDTNSVWSGQAEFIMGNGAVLPIHSIWNLAA